MVFEELAFAGVRIYIARKSNSSEPPQGFEMADDGFMADGPIVSPTILETRTQVENL
jgi:hypothetical protein